MSSVAGSTSLSQLGLSAERSSHARSGGDAAREGWSLDNNDVTLLRRLIAELRRLLVLAKANDEIVAVNEIVEAVEKVRDGEEPEPAVITLSVGIEDGNQTFSEGW